MLKVKMLLAAAIIAAGSTAALAQAGGGAAGTGAGAGAGAAGTAGGAGGEPARPTDPNAPGALNRGGSGTPLMTRRSDDMAPLQTAPTGFATAPSPRTKTYRRGRAYSQ